MTLSLAIPDTCTAQEAADLVAALAPELGISEDIPDIRTLRLWRTKKHLTIQGRRFTRRNILEVFALLKLRQEGLTHQHAVERVLALDDERMRLLLTGSARISLTHTDAEPLITLQLLAKGILEQYQQVKKGAIVGHTDSRKTGVHNIPRSLQQAMARLGRHYFSEGQEDHAASIHQLLTLCARPLHEWSPQAICDLGTYQQAVLIDPIYLVPNEDCEIIAEDADGTNLSDLVERHLHEQLRTTLKKLGDDADSAYTVVRAFIGRHPLATSNELHHLYLNPELTDEVIEFVRSLYQAVHHDDATDGQVRRCAYCHALIGRDGLCRLVGCREDYATADASPVPLDTAFLARSEVLKYWADPAREELRLYDTLCQHTHLRNRVYLYPHSDWCDVSLDDEVGIDVKDYRDPVRLAQRLNRSLGQLSQYPERIIAIAKRRWSKTYRDQLLEHLNPEKRAALRVMNVDETISYIQRTYGGSSSGAKS
jgi:hypothetical protein